MKLITILLLTYVLSGCTTSPLGVFPQIGDKYGADEIKCQYERKDKNYTLDCTVHDEGVINE